MPNVELPDGSILETEATTTLEDILTAKEVADYLGMSLLSLGRARIPHIRIGANAPLYLRPTVVAWIARREGK